MEDGEGLWVSLPFDVRCSHRGCCVSRLSSILFLRCLNFGFWMEEEDQERDAPATLEEGVSVACGSVIRFFGGMKHSCGTQRSGFDCLIQNPTSKI
jgi:hypothetical protein